MGAHVGPNMLNMPKSASATGEGVWFWGSSLDQGDPLTIKNDFFRLKWRVLVNFERHF